MHPAERKQNMQRLQRELKHLKEEPVPGVHAMVYPASLGPPSRQQLLSASTRHSSHRYASARMKRLPVPV